MSEVLQQAEFVAATWGTGVSPARSLPAPVLVGSRVVVLTSFADAGGTANVTNIVDDGGTTYTRCRQQGDPTLGVTFEVWSGIAASVDAGQNVVVTQSTTGTSGDDMIALYEVGNPDPDQVFDATNTNGFDTSSVTSHDSGAVTPGTTDSTIIAMSRGGSNTWTADPDFTNDLTNNRTTLSYREQADTSATSYTVTSSSASFAILIIVAFDASAEAGPIIANVDTDNIITSTQTGWDVNGADFDTATVEIRQDSVEIQQTVNSQDADSINCDTVFDAGAGPHLKYGAALLAVINADLSEDTIAITVNPPADREYVDLASVNSIADDRITAVPDLAAGDQLEISNVVGGTVADVNVNDDATFDVAEAVTSFDVRGWDADDQTWGPVGTQSFDDAPPPEGDAWSGGTLISADGIIQTLFLAAGAPVPGTAVFLNGIAHDTAGRRYVALWPASGIVTYSSGRALRTDGAQCIIEDSPDVYLAGFGYTNRGELCVTTSAGPNYIQGISVNNGLTAVSDLN